MDVGDRIRTLQDHLFNEPKHLDAAGPGGPILFRHELGRTGHGIDLARFTTTMRLAMICGEAPSGLADKFHLPTHEHSFPGHENIIEYEGWAVLAVTDVPAANAFQLSGIQ